MDTVVEIDGGTCRLIRGEANDGHRAVPEALVVLPLAHERPGDA